MLNHKLEVLNKSIPTINKFMAIENNYKYWRGDLFFDPSKPLATWMNVAFEILFSLQYPKNFAK